MVPRPGAFDLVDTYVHLADGGAAAPVECTAEFWSELMAGERYLEGRLVTAFHADKGTTHWEMHPQGDEVLYLQSGSADVVFEEGNGERHVALAAGKACVLAKGVWHRIIIHEPGDMIFITAGEGTQIRSHDDPSG